MLILCNSGSRIGYAENFLKSLFMPSGSVHELRYSKVGPFPYIEQSLIDELSDARGAEVLLVFIDRFATSGYVFYPARFGRLSSFRVDGRRAVLTVELGDYAHHADPTLFTSVVRTVAGPIRVPTAQDDRRSVDDGLYAFPLPADSSLLKVSRDGDAWRETVRQLRDLTAFAPPTGSDVLFARVQVLVDGQTVSLPPLSSIPGVRIRKDKAFVLRIEYFYPKQMSDETATLQTRVTPGAGVQVLSGNSYEIGTHEGSIDAVCVCEESADRKSVPVAISFVPPTGALLAPSGTVSIYIIESRRRALIGLLAIVAYVSGTAMLNAEGDWTVLGIGLDFFGVALQAISLYAMFTLTGKKLV